MIQAAINGSRSKKTFPQVPTSAAELSEEARLAISAGAGAIHFHVCDEQGKESLAFKDLNHQLNCMREVLPMVPIGISTGEWIEPDLSKRLSLISDWKELPDFISLNGDETGFEKVGLCCLRRGIGIEAGIKNAASAEAYLRSGLLEHCFRILLEPDEDAAEQALITVKEIELLMKTNGHLQGKSILLHGTENTAWPILKYALDHGYDTRIGLEDTLYTVDGEVATSNQILVRQAVLYASGTQRSSKNAIAG